MHHQQTYRAGRNDYPSSLSSHVSNITSGYGSKSVMSKSYLGEETRAGASSTARLQSNFTSRSMTSPNMSTSISSVASTTSKAPPSKTMPNLMHAKLHKRGSGSGATTNPGTSQTSISTNNASEPFPDLAPPAIPSPVAKVKPYLRKLSSTKEDQGRIDLSKSLAENDRLAGLGIQDHPSRSSTDVVFAPKHARTTSVGSQMSTSSTNLRSQPFVHPMRQAPRPYTPPTNRSYDDEDDDFIDDDHRPSFTFRPRRSMSNSSAQPAPTPLSQTITAADIGTLPRLTSASQSNLSIVSTKSSKPTGSRRNTGRSEGATSPSSRTSFDRPFIIGRRSDTETQTRDERIQAARRKFQEKEAEKDRRAEKDAAKKRDAEEAKELRRQERQRRQSDASDRAHIPQRPGTGGRANSALGTHSTLAYEVEAVPGPAVAVAVSEKQPRLTQKVTDIPDKGFFARIFSCGGSRRR